MASAPCGFCGRRRDPDRLVHWIALNASTEECWLWPHATWRGYGHMLHEGKNRRVHLLVWEYFNGPIPEDMQVDHDCHNWAVERGECKGGVECEHRRCTRPDHLVLRTNWENGSRGLSPSAIHARKTHCVNGHELTEDNLYRRKDQPNSRQCKTCAKEKARVLYYRSREVD